ncbi:mandelate racemase/muconate lactonizing enzyme family protein [Hyphomonas adhaerens MHS-3]|uniref:Dipeptide epimerase n=1 Tax=Hyphomonas adhaerens MHS-3 TaxID=1280949 RepID=A0A069E315_9PROT|nr:N-acetyl-D-Glu racemase DgcA [Hyphomonas adhaerens]KCZ84164.1 mandelate racemase/muconate lactonizing enzyme family protein [Hyphomonas adhaerens MHS-3]
MGNRNLEISAISSPLKTAFTISRGAKTSAETIRVTLSENGATGRGESVPYARYGETVDSVIAAIDSARSALTSGLSREDLQTLMPAGAARCAVDCAMWDLEAKLAGKPVWQLAGLPEPKPVETAVTVSLDTPDAMAAAARETQGRLLKLKLGGPDDLARIEAVHTARPDARLIVDANEGLNESQLPAIASAAAQLGVVLIEQPFPAGADDALLRRPGPVAICADESAHTRSELQDLARRYDAVNVKLDKTGGLTEALAMVRDARAMGLGIMVGCMVAGSISMAPAVLLAGLADLMDVDGPLWLAQDVAHGLAYSDGMVAPPTPDLWG